MAAGAARGRPERASAKMTSISPSVATTSDRKCAPLARSFTEMLMAAWPNMRFAITAPVMHPPSWAGR